MAAGSVFWSPLATSSIVFTSSSLRFLPEDAATAAAPSGWQASGGDGTAPASDAALPSSAWARTYCALMASVCSTGTKEGRVLCINSWHHI